MKHGGQIPQSGKTATKGCANLHIPCDNGVSIEEAAKVMKVGPRSVASARKVQANGTPKLQEAVSQGKMKVSEAVKHVAKPRAGPHHPDGRGNLAGPARAESAQRVAAAGSLSGYANAAWTTLAPGASNRRGAASCTVTTGAARIAWWPGGSAWAWSGSRRAGTATWTTSKSILIDPGRRSSPVGPGPAGHAINSRGRRRPCPIGPRAGRLKRQGHAV
jgi:hypothetical protein